MPQSNDEVRSIENELQREFQEMAAKRKKLEEAINRVDAATKHLIEKAALQDIAAHKSRCPLPSQSGRSRSEADRKPAVITLQATIAKASSLGFVKSKKAFLPVAQSGSESLPLWPVR
jgi:predicted phage gp36 major capsid-like protein